MSTLLRRFCSSRSTRPFKKTRHHTVLESAGPLRCIRCIATATKAFGEDSKLHGANADHIAVLRQVEHLLRTQIGGNSVWLERVSTAIADSTGARRPRLGSES